MYLSRHVTERAVCCLPLCIWVCAACVEDAFEGLLVLGKEVHHLLESVLALRVLQQARRGEHSCTMMLIAMSHLAIRNHSYDHWTHANHAKTVMAGTNVHTAGRSVSRRNTYSALITTVDGNMLKFAILQLDLERCAVFAVLLRGSLQQLWPDLLGDCGSELSPPAEQQTVILGRESKMKLAQPRLRTHLIGACSIDTYATNRQIAWGRGVYVLGRSGECEFASKACNKEMP